MGNAAANNSDMMEKQCEWVEFNAPLDTLQVISEAEKQYICIENIVQFIARHHSATKCYLGLWHLKTK